MQMVADLQHYDGYTKVFFFRELDDETKEKALQRFSEYMKRGVILKGSFPDDAWYISDEVKRRHIRFREKDGMVQGLCQGLYRFADGGDVSKYDRRDQQVIDKAWLLFI